MSNPVLTTREDEWFLAYFAKHIAGCNLVSFGEPANHRQLFRLSKQGSLFQSNAPLDNIIFYPELRYSGIRIFPWHSGWKRDSHEPILQCWVDPVGVENSPDAEENRRRVDALKQNGWAWSAREGGVKYLHVDEIEKIEGPPPEGPF